MAKKVGIPVEVEGGPKAQQDLRRTGQAVEDLGKSGKKAASGLEELKRARVTPEQQRADEAAFHAWRQQEEAAAGAAKQTKKAGEQTRLFADDAKTAASALLSAFNPALGAAVNLAADLVKGLRSINPVLLLITAAAAVFTGIASMISAAAQRADDFRKSLDAARDAMKRLREEAAGDQKSLADMLAEAGVTGGAAQANATVNRLREQRGIERPLGEMAAAAQQIGGLSEAEMLQFVAGWFAEGQGQKFTRNQDDNRKLIADMLAAGAKPENVAFLQGRIRDLAPHEAAGALPDAALDPVGQKWRGLIEAYRRQNALNDADVEALERYLNSREAAPDRRVLDAFREQVNFWSDRLPVLQFGQGGPKGQRALRRQIGDEQVEGGTRTIDELVRLAEELRQQFARGLGPQLAGGPGGAPITINIDARSTNVAQAFNSAHPPERRRTMVNTSETIASGR